MSDQLKPVSGHEEPACVFCAHTLAPDDCVASIRLPSHEHGHRYFGAHARCWREALPPEVARHIDLTDVPPGLDHFLLLPA
jgi:hypothetical protein